MEKTKARAGKSNGKRRGIYETEYGNAAYVSGPRARRAWDLDMGAWVPLCEVTDTFVRDAEPYDEPDDNERKG